MRDLRIDFFRGLALYMVVVDHIGGDPLGKFTYQAVGFSDAAEIFIFISGMACGIAYSSLLEPERLGCLDARAGSAHYPKFTSIMLCPARQ